MTRSIIYPGSLEREPQNSEKEQKMLLIANTLREILKGLPVAIYGSGAQALLELSYNERVGKMPNDIDIATKDLTSLKELLSRMKKDSKRFHVDPKGIYKKFPQENTEVFEGFLIIGEKKIPFECYGNTRIITSEAWDHLQPVLGVPVFHPEDLQRTYARVLAIEAAACNEAEEIAKYVYKCLPTIDARPGSEQFRKCLSSYLKKPEELEEAVDLFTQHEAYENFRESEAFARWTQLCTGHKLKAKGDREKAITKLKDQTVPIKTGPEVHL